MEEAKVWRDAQQEVVSMLQQQNEECTNELWRAQVSLNMSCVQFQSEEKNVKYIDVYGNLQRQRDSGGANAIRAIAGVCSRSCEHWE